MDYWRQTRMKRSFPPFAGSSALSILSSQSPTFVMDEVLAGKTATRRGQLHVLGVLAIVAVVLSGVGIYGLLAYTVSQRSPEIGVRLALGAESSRVGRMIFADRMRLALIGIVPGILGAYAAARGMSALLFGVAPGLSCNVRRGRRPGARDDVRGFAGAGVSGFADYADVHPESRVVGLHSRSTRRPARRSTAAIASRMTSSRKRRPTSWTPAGRSSTKSIGTTPAGRPR